MMWGMQYIIVMYKRFFMMFGRGESLFSLPRCVSAHRDDIPSSKFPFFIIFVTLYLPREFLRYIFCIKSLLSGVHLIVDCCSEPFKSSYLSCILVSPPRTLTAFTPLAFCSPLLLLLLLPSLQPKHSSNCCSPRTN